MSTEGERSHLLIGMVLADIFLLVLLIVWWGYRNDRDAPLELSSLRERMAVLEADLAAAHSAMQRQEELRAKYEQMKKALERLSVAAGIESPNLDDLATRPDSIVDALRRGAPACAKGQNVAVRVLSSVDGEVAEIVSADFAHALASIMPVSVGHRVSGDELHTFLAATRRLYDNLAISGNKCRYDYSLVWSDDVGYRRSREAFEAVFYPAGVTRRQQR